MGFLVQECLLLDVLKKRKMKQAEYARRVGVTKQYVQKLIKNESVMSIEIMFNTRIILECELEDLYKFKLQKKEE